MLRFFLPCLLCLLPHIATAQTTGQIGRVGFGSRGIAVGNGLAGDPTGLASPFYNPALAPYVKSQSLELSAALMTHDRQLQFVELRTPLKPLAGIAAGLIHTGVRNIDQRDLSGYHTGVASTNEYVFFAAFGVRVGDRASLGVGLQLFRNSLHSNLPTTQTLGLDIGIGIQVLPSLHIGLVLDDLLAKYRWDGLGEAGGVTDKFPVRLRAGASWILMEERLQVLAEYESSFSSRNIREPRVVFAGSTPQEAYDIRELILHQSHFRIGAEFFLVPVLSLRAGMGRIEEISRGGPRPSAGFMIEQSLGLLVTQVAYTLVLEPLCPWHDASYFPTILPLECALLAGLSMLLFSIPVMAQDTGLSFMRIGVNARAASMGDAQVAISDNAFATYWNPAALAGGKKSVARISSSMDRRCQGIRCSCSATNWNQPCLGLIIDRYGYGRSGGAYPSWRVGGQLQCPVYQCWN